MYWEKVLNEVINKSSKSETRFTNINCKGASTPKKHRYNTSSKTRKQKNKELAKEPNISFTRRETDCLLCFLQGKTMNQTARTLGLSQRTVEFYVKNMRKKTDCRTKSELIQTVINENLLEQQDDNQGI